MADRRHVGQGQQMKEQAAQKAAELKALFQAWKLQNAIHIVGMKARNMGSSSG